ncbi:MAG: hypothetical protein LBO06_07765, partial [Bacteroidales bacterium]|nr:hypothetical protein [Bacteroidales bacterium]
MKRALVFIIMAFVVCNFALADSWMPPTIQKYYSNNGKYLLEIVPSILPDKYWQWQNASEEEKKIYLAEDTIRVPCYAVIYEVNEMGTKQVWKQKLLNEISPVDAIIADDGETFVTFDDWHGMGYGNNVMVVYQYFFGRTRRYSLKEISPFPTDSYLESVSSIWWSCGKKYIEDNLIEICFQDTNETQIKRIYNVISHKLYDKTDGGIIEVPIHYEIMDMINQQNNEPKVTGIGGIFFKSEDTEKLRQWYASNLGLEVNEYGSTFETRNANNPNEINYL